MYLALNLYTIFRYQQESEKVSKCPCSNFLRISATLSDVHRGFIQPLQDSSCTTNFFSDNVCLPLNFSCEIFHDSSPV